MLADALGIRLAVLIGAALSPLRYDAITALTRAEVLNNDQSGDAFELEFAIGKGQSRDFSLLQRGMLDPDTRVSLWVLIGTTREALMDGVITQHHINYNVNGSATLTVKGHDFSVLLDRESKRDPFPQQSSSQIVEQILNQLRGQYPTLSTRISTPSNDAAPQESQRIPQQQSETSLQLIRRLASQYGYVFYIETSGIGRSTAYWGQPTPTGSNDNPLIYQLGGRSNVDSLRFGDDAEAHTQVRAAFLDTSSQSPQVREIQPQQRTPDGMGIPSQALRTEFLHCGARFDQQTATSRAQGQAERANPAISGSGELRTIRYGHVLRARKMVELRGGGSSHNGPYYVSSVTHSLSKGEYKQSFSLQRQGRQV